MVLIPAGRFLMGRERDEPHPGNDLPQHEVYLSKAYYLDAYEVTGTQWAMFLRSTGYAPEGAVECSRPSEPVAGVSHRDASEYARWVGCTLPSEAQWERAARGGVVGRAFPWGDDDDVTRRNGLGSEDGYDGVAPVGSFPPNPFGLFDMIGNVQEWCADGFVPQAYLAGPRADPLEPEARQFAVRGGSWYESGVKLRTSYREGRRDLLDMIGFRCCRVSIE